MLCLVLLCTTAPQHVFAEGSRIQTDVTEAPESRTASEKTSAAEKTTEASEKQTAAEKTSVAEKTTEAPESRTAAEKSGGDVTGWKLEFSGLCAKCRNQQKKEE